MPPFVTRFFPLNEDAGDRYQLTIWFSASEIIFKLANWMTLIGLFKYLADKSSSGFASAIYWVLNIAFLGVISGALNYVEFTPLKPTSGARRTINFFVHVILSLVVFFALMIVVNKIVNTVGQIKAS